jgi:hypothetical protein
LWFHKDWSVTFHKVEPESVDGHEIYFFGWSGMEYIFCTDAGQEALIRHAKVEWEGDEESDEEI